MVNKQSIDFSNNRGSQSNQIVVQNFYEGSSGMERDQPHGGSDEINKLYKPKAFISLPTQFLIEIVALIADLLEIYNTVSSCWQKSSGDFVILKVTNTLTLMGNERLHVLIIFLLLPLCFSFFINTIKLCTKHMVKDLVRSKAKVYRIVPTRCPECGSKLKYTHKDKEWAFQCSRVKDLHKWVVDPTKLKLY